MTKKVAVLGASGGIGQPLCMLLKLSKHVDELSCYDVVRTPGVAADLSHIPTKATVSGFLPSSASFPPPKGDSGLEAALKNADVVVIPAGVPRKPGMTRDDLFHTNAGIIKKLIEGCADYCPNAFIAVITNPVNSTVPIASKILKAKGVYNPKKLCGVTTLDACRANTFAGRITGTDPNDIDVTVIGGHAGITILPLYSQLDGFTNNLSDEELNKLTHKTQFGGDEVVAAKAGAGSATLSMAYAGYLFTENVLRALNGEKEITQCAYVESSLHTNTAFFASPCKFGTDGIEEVMDYGKISDYEKELLEKMLPDLEKQIKKGMDFC